jgi:hypothetical protein
MATKEKEVDLEDPIYCVKCKKKTKNLKAKVIETANGRQAIRARCAKLCSVKEEGRGTKKMKFI